MKWLDRKGWKTAICSSLLLRLGFLVLLTIGITGCWYPLFNLDVAVGEQLVGKLGAPQFIFSGSHNFYHGEQYTFIPIRLSEPIQGLAVSERNPREQFVWDIFNSNFLSSFRLEIQNYTPGPPVFPITFDHFDSTDPVVYYPVISNNRLTLGYKYLAQQTITPIGPGTANEIRVAIGVSSDFSFTPPSNPNLIVKILDYNTVMNELTLRQDPGVSSSSFPDQMLFEPPAGSILIFDYLQFGIPSIGFIGKYPIVTISGAPESYIFSGKMSDGRLRTIGWFASGPAALTTTTPIQLSNITTQISTILSTGELLSILDEQLIIYSPLGESNFVINNGNVRFVHERYDQTSDQWVSVFTRNLRTQDTLIFEVYEYPTSNLRDLAN